MEVAAGLSVANVKPAMVEIVNEQFQFAPFPLRIPPQFLRHQPRDRGR